MAADRRARESPANDCVHCHMPRSPTEIPHLAFTHHRIGVHDRPPPAAARGVAELRPFHDLSRVGEADRQRSLGLGYLEAANREKDPAWAADFRDRAAGLLAGARAAGLPDPALATGLARVRFDLDLTDVLPPAEEALTDPALVGQDRCTALYLIADQRARQGRHMDAVPALRELTGLRRHPLDYLLLASWQRALANAAAEAAALEAAVRINPRLWRVHQTLADRATRRGDAVGAERHRRRAVP